MFEQHEAMLAFCRDTLKSHSDEAAWRCGSHAAYYALFQAALKWAEHRGFRLDSEQSVHKQLREFYLAQSDKKDKLIGRKLASTFHTRRNADYAWNNPIGKNTFDKHLLECQQSITDIKRHHQQSLDPKTTKVKP